MPPRSSSLALADEYEWLDIEDFTPGIHQRKFNKSIPGGALVSDGPVGSAHRDLLIGASLAAPSTFGCYALPEGSLAPLPFGGSPSLAIPSQSLTPPYGPITVLGLQTVLGVGNSSFNPVFPPGKYPEEIWVALYSPNNNNASSRFTLARYQEWLGSPVWETVYAVSPASTLGVLGGQHLPVTRINNTPPYLTAGQAVLGFIDPLTPSNRITPNLGSPNVTSSQQIDNNLIRFHYAHQNRLIDFVNIPSSWNTGAFLLSNGAINYTDPPNSPTMGAQNEVFSPEHPFGYGAISSVNAGELLLIKHDSGAVLITGDLNNPTVTYLPNVPSTYGIGCIGDVGSEGFVYTTPYGVFAWRGGDTAVLLSQQLDDNFLNFGGYVSPITDTYTPQYQATYWGTWIVFSNNWLYDTVTKSWWVLGDNTGSLQWWRRGWQTRLIGAVGSVSTDGAAGITILDRTQPSTKYQWVSNPIFIGMRDRFTDQRSIVIEAKAGKGSQSITIQLWDSNNNQPASALVVFHPGTNNDEIHLANITCQSPYVYMVITAQSTGTAPLPPTIRAVHLGYQKTNAMRSDV